MPSPSCLETWQWGLHQPLKHRSISQDNNHYKGRTFWNQHLRKVLTSSSQRYTQKNVIGQCNHGSSYDAGKTDTLQFPLSSSIGESVELCKVKNILYLSSATVCPKEELLVFFAKGTLPWRQIWESLKSHPLSLAWSHLGLDPCSELFSDRSSVIIGEYLSQICGSVSMIHLLGTSDSPRSMLLLGHLKN